MNWVQWDWVNRNWMVWGRVNGNCVDRFGMNRGWLLRWGGMSNTVIFHISYIAAIASDISSVVDNLDAAIRKSHLVLASHNVGVRCLFLVEAGTRVVVMDTILKSIRLGWLCIAMHRSWLVNNRQGVNRSWWWCIGSGMNWQNGTSSVGRCQGRDENSSF